jgi:uncharacterized protein (TIGR03032 family)
MHQHVLVQSCEPKAFAARMGSDAIAETGRPPAETEAPPPTPEPRPWCGVHSTSFGRLLHELGCSVLVTTYQAGKLVVLSRGERGTLDARFRAFPKPKGLAVDGDRLAIGTALEVREFRTRASIARRLEPASRHDAWFLPRCAHFTGDARIHEMAWAGDELWFVDTRFSCLWTRGEPDDFVSRWRPSFVTALAPEDRCHLNGLGVREGKVRYVTALGETDAPGGWRAHKKDGGVLIDVEADEVIARGLSMPHSPRWYAGRLWVLQSGTGGLGTIDPATGRYEEVASLPGFTRGLDFAGPLAFVGVSQVRESAVFSGIPIAERPLEESCCGVWVVNLETGRLAAFVKFEDTSQEIFAVQVLHGRRRADVLNEVPIGLAGSFVVPDEALADVAAPFRKLATRKAAG